MISITIDMLITFIFVIICAFNISLNKTLKSTGYDMFLNNNSNNLILEIFNILIVNNIIDFYNRCISQSKLHH